MLVRFVGEAEAAAIGNTAREAEGITRKSAMDSATEVDRGRGKSGMSGINEIRTLADEMTRPEKTDGTRGSENQKDTPKENYRDFDPSRETPPPLRSRRQPRS